MNRSQRGTKGPPQREAQGAKVPTKTYLQDIITNCMLEELSEENYLSIDKVFKRIEYKFGSISTVDDQRVFFQMTEMASELNKEISLLLDVYFLTNPVKTVLDCEKYVTKMLKNWMVTYKKRTGVYETFEAASDHFVTTRRLCRCSSIKKHKQMAYQMYLLVTSFKSSAILS